MTHSSLGFFFCSDNRGKDPRKGKKETFLSGCRKKRKLFYSGGKMFSSPLKVKLLRIC